MSITSKASSYTGITDAEFLGYDAEARKKWGLVEEKKKTIEANNKQLAEWQTEFTDLNSRAGDYENPLPADQASRLAFLRDQIALWTSSKAPNNGLSREVFALQGEAQVQETKRDNRGAAVTQTGENLLASYAGAEAVKNENLLSRNINQEIQGRIARNISQADEAQKSIGENLGATIGQQAARAGQAGVDVGSGTTGVMADAASAKSAADKSAIEGYRIGLQNLLMGQGDAATKAAESLTGAINTQTTDWATKSTSAVGDVTGNLLKNVETVVGTGYFEGDAQTQGVKDSQAAVGTTLDTWSLDSYRDVLDTLTSHSANKTTWDQMLLEQAGAPTNPYSSYNAAISPLTPVAGTKNLLAAAAGEQDLSGVYTLSGSKSKSASLI